MFCAQRVLLGRFDVRLHIHYVTFTGPTVHQKQDHGILGPDVLKSLDKTTKSNCNVLTKCILGTRCIIIKNS